jgi:cysteine desulfurase
MKTIPLDYAATTPLAPGVLDAMLPWLTEADGNPSASHAAGQRARAAVKAARGQVAALIGAEPARLIWTSGATESINLALKGVLAFRGEARAHLISSRIEHRATLETLRWLEQQGHRLTLLRPDREGRHTVEQVLAALRPDTALVSLMWVNNEIGSLNPIGELAAELRARGVLLHVDAAQAAAWLPIDLGHVPIDLLSLSAHKLGGPKGIGALYLGGEPRLGLTPLLHGGSQEQGLRAGTLPVHQIVGFGAAAARVAVQRTVVAERVRRLRETLYRALQEQLPDLIRNSPEDGAAHILNVSIPGVDGESLRALLPGLLFSSGSACASTRREPSFVLRALGRSDALAEASLRLSLGEASHAGQVEDAAAAIIGAVRALRALGPDAASVALPAAAAGGPGRVNLHGYPDAVWQRFSAPGHLGLLSAPGLRRVVQDSPAGTERLLLQVAVADGRLSRCRALAFGCPYTLAAADWLAERLQGQPVSALLRIQASEVIAALEIPPEKTHCALMVEDAAQALRRQLQDPR